MLEEMEGDLATAKKDEATAATGFEELSAAKASEIASATSAIESKTKRSGEVAVEVVQTQDDMEDSEAIKVLNDDDALDLFKKTVPSMVQTGLEFLQKSSKSSVALRAKGLLVSLMQTGRAHTTQLSLMASALKSKAVDFSKIT